jgi:hypothetical protein
LSFSATRSAASRAGIALVSSIAALLLAPPAQAAPPTVTSVGHSARQLTAEWTLPAGMATGAIEAATSPATDADGFFLLQNTVLYVELADTATTFQSPVQLPPGTYYVHVAAYDPAAPACIDPYVAECIWEFSNPPSVVTIPPDPPPPPPPPPPAPPPPPSAAPTPAPDTITAFSVLRAPSKQDVDKLFVAAAMGESGTLSAGGTVSVPGASKVFKLKAVTATAVPAVTVKLKLKLPAKALKAVKKALKRKKKIKAKIRITAKDSAGNTKVENRTIALKP